MRRRTRTRGEGAFGLVVGLAVLFVVVVALFKIVPLHIQGNEILDAMSEAANFGGLKPVDKLRQDIYFKAQEARVPLQMQDITRRARAGPTSSSRPGTRQTVDIFGYKYVYNFDRKVEKPVF